VRTDLPPPAKDAALDVERGRTHDRAALRLALASAPSDYLRGALDNPALGAEELALLLSNRGASPDLLTRVGRNRAWMGSREVKHALVSHPKTPTVVSRSYLPHLFWRELVGLAGDMTLPPLVRREAEKLVRLRLPELSLGERVALARVASRGLIATLREQAEAAVLEALAGNPRTTEDDLVRTLQRPGLPSEFLGWLAGSSAWSRRGPIGLALLRHPRTPPAAALRLLQELTPEQLDTLERDERAPRLVRIAASRRLAVDTPSDASLQSPAVRPHPESRGLSTS
jgi:hypothetical protein